MDQLATLTKEINALDVEANKRIEEQVESKIQDKLAKRISQEVVINKVKLSEVITKIQGITQLICQILFKLCTVETFTIKINDKIKQLDNEIKASAQAALTEPQAFSKHILKVQ